MTHDELKARLRSPGIGAMWGPSPFEEAADAIERLEAELDRCRKSNAVMDNTVRELEADNARLREALGEIWEWIGNWSPDFIWDDEWPATEAKARAALQETSHD